MKNVSIKKSGKNSLPANITKQYDLHLSRAGLYKDVVSWSKSIEKIMLGELKSDFWEFQEFHENDPKVMPIKLDQKKFYTGSKNRKIKKIKTTLKSSHMFYSLHSLTRYRERTWGKEININDFFSIDDSWVNELSDAGFGKIESLNDTSRQDLFFPFGEGAFLGHMGVFHNYSIDRVETYTTTYHKSVPFYSISTDLKNKMSMPAFTARTYIGREDFTWFQEQIFNQYHSNDWEGAIDTLKNNSMKESHWKYKVAA